VKKVERGSQQVPILHWISREHYAMHATQLFIGRSGVPHAHVECAPMHGAHSTEKAPFLNRLDNFL